MEVSPALTQSPNMETQVRAFLIALQAQNRYADNTILSYQQDLQHFSNYIQNHLGRPPVIMDFNAVQIRDFLRTEQNFCKPSTLRRRSAALRQLGLFLAQTGKIETFEFPVLDEILPNNTDSGTPNEISVLSESEVAHLMCAVQADPRSQARRDEALLALVLETGLSVSRLVALDLADFEPHNQRLCLRKPPKQADWFSLAECGPTLQKYLQEGRPELNPVTGETALFISQIGRRLSRQSVWQIFQRWGTRANLSGRLSPRSLRYTAAQRMIRAGYAEKTIQEILDHHIFATTREWIDRFNTAQNSRPQE